MSDRMTFPDTVEEFMDTYKVVDRDGYYMSKGTELVPVFRMKQWFEHLSTADVVPVVHGEWISECEPHYECSECHHWFHLYQYMNYCPNCGAKMDGEERVR
ncbi:MAG: hypothetical protein LIR50_10070 [Bacillota bacterium]|nr:hypothetical protein [Bacillota bacterium]